ncbi:MAG TPA: hypothetical protein VJ183_19440 [Chloroflexia bacterium]|nr:hypothetical protein [Chloroflexia bacterium]
MSSRSDSTYPGIIIYLDNPELRTRIKLAAARKGVTVSAYCVEAIRRRIEEEDFDENATAQKDDALSPHLAAQASDDLRRSIGRIGVPVSELISEGRR